MYRKQDLKFLQDIFDRSSNDIAILYGKRDNGLDGLVTDLCKDKESLYYVASEVSDKLQKELFAGELHEQTRSPIFPEDDYEKLIDSYINNGSGKKKLIVFDDFQHLINTNPTFINFLSNLLFEKIAPGNAMFLLVCDDVNWTERDMVRLIGRKSSEISGVLKLGGYTPTQFREEFPDIPLREIIGIYSVIGGKSSFYDLIGSKTTLHDLLLDILAIWTEPQSDRNMFLPRQVREPLLYNTILACIAKGINKLGDIHEATGVDRAKLSVYIKTLIDNDLIAKAVSAKVGNDANTKKGMYIFKDRLALFYYRFVFPNVSSLRLLGPDRFYKKFVERGINAFIDEYYPAFCMEQIRWLRDNGRLNFKVAQIEEYYDKSGAIDFVIVAVGGSVIACSCTYQAPHMSFKQYEDVKTAVRRNRIPCDNIWLFSAGGFDQKLTMTGTVTPGVNLIEGTEQRLR